MVHADGILARERIVGSLRRDSCVLPNVGVREEVVADWDLGMGRIESCTPFTRDPKATRRLDHHDECWATNS